ncbi:hypothetical protein FB472_2669 [Rhodoglobus vestalii]|uniref:Uncharacterized protein n=1 Tax=Rhodoglobus vestalii TaxID=193384 RepID=A0A8H2PVM2_9MICO|nr:hypothetical protein [Rhodoglobus vestalii]TQO21007.1 hypothetical protein FB472_2669 [Rhodoglobus vestalii]
MASLLSQLVPFLPSLRGPKRMFSDPHKTLERIEQLQKNPANFEPQASLARQVNITSRVVNGWTAFDVGEGMIHNYPILPIPGGTAARAVVAKAIS